jgi:hypothetical protein
VWRLRENETARTELGFHALLIVTEFGHEQGAAIQLLKGRTMPSIMNSTALRMSVLACSVAVILSGQAVAQNAPVEFRMAAASGNPSGCTRFDAALSRVHTFTASGDTASVTSSGGVTGNLSQTSPRVYGNTFNVGGTQMTVVADASKTPRTLEVSEPRMGCRWNAVAP